MKDFTTKLQRDMMLGEPNETFRNHESEQEHNYVAMLLDEAGEYGLESEVVVWALREMKLNPKLSVSEAIKIGFDEWVK